MSLVDMAKDIADRMYTLFFRYVSRFAYKVCRDLGDVSLCDRVSISLIHSIVDKYGEEAEGFISGYAKYEDEIGVSVDVPYDLALDGEICCGIAHELYHARDAERLGKDEYDRLYAEYSEKYGYFNNPFEREANEFGRGYINTPLCKAVTYLYLAFTRFLIGCSLYEKGDMGTYVECMDLSKSYLKEFVRLRGIDESDRSLAKKLIADIDRFVESATA